MSALAMWLMVVLTFELALVCFLMFAARGLPWYRRGLSALFSLGFLIIFLAMLYYALSGRSDELSPFDPAFVVASFAVVNLLVFGIGAMIGLTGYLSR